MNALGNTFFRLEFWTLIPPRFQRETEMEVLTVARILWRMAGTQLEAVAGAIYFPYGGKNN